MSKKQQSELRLPRIVRVKSESWKRSKPSFKSSGPTSASKLIFGQRKGRTADFTSRFSSNFGDSSISSLKIQEARAERDRQRALERIHRIAEIREKLEISKRDMIERKRKLAEERKKEKIWDTSYFIKGGFRTGRPTLIYSYMFVIK